MTIPSSSITNHAVVVVLLILLSSSFATIAAPLDLPQINSGFLIRNVGARKCLALDASKGKNLATLEECGGDHQTFKYNPENQWIEIADGLCLATVSGTDTSWVKFSDCSACGILLDCAWSGDDKGHLKEINDTSKCATISHSSLRASAPSSRALLAMEGCADDDEAFSFETHQYMPPVTGQVLLAAGSHFQTWAGERYTFLGECDFIFLDNPTFASGIGMQIQLRTKVHTTWSYVKSAAIQIGNDRLELQGSRGSKSHESTNYWINGRQEKAVKDGDSFLLAGYRVHYEQQSPTKSQLRIDLGGNSEIVLKTSRAIAAVHVRAQTSGLFDGSLGLLGHFPEGTMLARDGTTVMPKEDAGVFAMEWQRLSSEPTLFHTTENTIQQPQECLIAQKGHTGLGGLRQGLVTREEAEEACADVVQTALSACIHDVLATNDKGIAIAY